MQGGRRVYGLLKHLDAKKLPKRPARKTVGLSLGVTKEERQTAKEIAYSLNPTITDYLLGLHRHVAATLGKRRKA